MADPVATGLQDHCHADGILQAGQSERLSGWSATSATAKKAIDELIEGGFLREERRGRSRGNAASRERVASLTRYNTDAIAEDPDLPMKTWERRKKSGRQKSAA